MVVLNERGIGRIAATEALEEACGDDHDTINWFDDLVYDPRMCYLF